MTIETSKFISEPAEGQQAVERVARDGSAASKQHVSTGEIENAGQLQKHDDRPSAGAVDAKIDPHHVGGIQPAARPKKPDVPVKLSPNLRTNIPALMKAQDYWVLWKHTWSTKKKNWAKVLYNPHTGQYGKTNDLSTCDSFENVIARYDRGGYDGIGFVFSGHLLLGIDLDACRNPKTDETAEWAVEFVMHHPGYWEITPSGGGFHGWFRLQNQFDPHPNKFLGMPKFMEDYEKTPQVEIYTDKRYFTVTGEAVVIEGGRIVPGVGQLTNYDDSIYQELITKYPKESGAKSNAKTVRPPRAVASNGEDQSSIDQSALTRVLLNMPSGTTPEELETEVRKRASDGTLKVPIAGESGLRWVPVKYRPKWDDPRSGDSWLLYSARNAKRFVDGLQPEEREKRRREDTPTYPFTDMGNAERLRDAHGENARYDYARRKWWCWTETQWQVDMTGTVPKWAQKTVRKMRGEATTDDVQNRTNLLKHQASSESRNRIESMIRVAEPMLAINISQFDRNAELFNVQNGTIDLLTGMLRDHCREDFITKISPVIYDSAATCPGWLEFINTITDGGKELAGYLQRAAGYSLIGENPESALFILHGSGANGKSTFLEVLRYIMGDYSDNIDPKSLMVLRSERARNDLAKLKGARYVTTHENEADDHLAEGLMKALTGGDQITARFLYGEEFSYKPGYKIFMATNHLPTIAGTDWGTWRRIRIIKFPRTIPSEKQTKGLAGILKKEASGILNWCLAGLAAWRKGGLSEPRTVLEVTQRYREEMDVLERFINSCCSPGPNACARSSQLHEAFCSWAKDNELPILSTKKFAEGLSSKGYMKQVRKDGKYWCGIEHKTVADRGCPTAV